MAGPLDGVLAEARYLYRRNAARLLRIPALILTEYGSAG